MLSHLPVSAEHADMRHLLLSSTLVSSAGHLSEPDRSRVATHAPLTHVSVVQTFSSSHAVLRLQSTQHLSSAPFTPTSHCSPKLITPFSQHASPFRSYVHSPVLGSHVLLTHTPSAW
eukprot:Mycagemm_TRINITY_DN10242_c0_g2::TRINITY_DN10242_c0_g2_i1::g.4153::m.4153 type:complete len:117 gc:universal TRINITY_DN10242_c0_g2_i1:1119-1469(+)